MRVSPKYLAFLRHAAEAEFLEGTTAAGKTTVGALKFMLQVARSPKPQHILAGLDLGTVEKNVITKPFGILDEWGAMAEYNGGGTVENRMPHILFRPAPGVAKTVFVLGYDDKRRWKKALGGQYGCLMVDEVNIADMDFLREAAMRCDYLLATLNPDDPALPVYREFVNRSRPLPEWASGTPEPILEALSEPANPGWTHWFFGFGDNIALDEAKVGRIKRNVPEGTKLWKNKVLGLRGRATGLVFPTYDPRIHDIAIEDARALLPQPADRLARSRRQAVPERFATFTSGLDTAYSQLSADTISMTFGGITDAGRYVLLDCREYDNAVLDVPLAPSDVVREYTAFLDRNRREWGLARHCFVDSADQATLTELRKWKRAHAECLHVFEPAHKRLPNIDRIELQLGWMAGRDPAFRILAERCAPYVRELLAYSWDESRDSVPEDANDHSVQSCQYSWIPYRERIGREDGVVAEDEGERAG